MTQSIGNSSLTYTPFKSTIPNALSIAGLDPSGGAGILADVKVFSAFGVFGCAIPTALTAQNTQTVSAIHVPNISFFREQLDTLWADVYVHAFKLGMLANVQLIDALNDFLTTNATKLQRTWLVCDPVMISKSGHALLKADAVDSLITKIFPHCDLITPNIPEAYALLGEAEPEQLSLSQMPELALRLHRHLGLRSNQWLLLKGGHTQSADGVCDYVCQGDRVEALPSIRIQTKNTHGTGCSYSAALTALLAKQQMAKQQINQTFAFQPKQIEPDAMLALVKQAQTYIWHAIKHADLLRVGDVNQAGSRGPLHHFYEGFPD